MSFRGRRGRTVPSGLDIVDREDSTPLTALQDRSPNPECNVSSITADRELNREARLGTEPGLEITVCQKPWLSHSNVCVIRLSPRPDRTRASGFPVSATVDVSVVTILIVRLPPTKGDAGCIRTYELTGRTVRSV